MGHILRNPKFLAAGLVLAVLAVAGGVFFVTTNPATAEKTDWPSLTMRYSETGSIDDQSVAKDYLLTYNSYSNWREEMMSADPIETVMGTLAKVGSYRQLQGRTYTEYDSITGSTETETLDDDVTLLPRHALTPMKVSVVEDAYDQRATEVTTSARVCFESTCTDNAPGLKLVLEGQTVIFAKDARGIPIQVGNFVVDEIMVGAPVEEYVAR